jgi:AraC-like DNA-binding protein
VDPLVDAAEVQLRRYHSDALAGLVAGVVGFSEQNAGVVARPQPAGSLTLLRLSLGDRLSITTLSDGQVAKRTYESFVAGFQIGHTFTEFDRVQNCIQIFLTPPGVSRILGVAGAALAQRVVAVEEVAPAFGPSFVDEVASAPDWQARFAILEARLVQLVARGPESDPLVAWMWRRIRSQGGRVRIDDLVRRSGWSHRHVSARFREQVGVSPKEAAAVTRFECAIADLPVLPTLAAVAARHGYTDQSHLARDCARYAGESPAALRAAKRATAHTALGTRPDVDSVREERWRGRAH